MDKLNGRVVKYKGYKVVAYENGDIIIFKRRRFVMQAYYTGEMNEAALLNTLDSMLAIRESIQNQKEQIVRA